MSLCTQCPNRAAPHSDLCVTCALVKRFREARRAAAVLAPAPKAALRPEHVASETPVANAPQRSLEAANDEPAYTPYAQGIVTGVHQGLAVRSDELLLSASKLAATLGAVPASMSAAQSFLNFNQKHFYNHMRVMLRALDGRKKLPGKKRTGQIRNIPPAAKTNSNENLARALRFIRIYLQIEQKPMCLMINRSHAALWHIESAHHVIHPPVVAAYGNALNIDPDRIYRYANALGRGRAKDHDAVDMVTKFVDIIVRGK